MWPNDVNIGNTVGHLVIAADQNGAGPVFLRYLQVDSRPGGGGHGFVDLTLDGEPYTPIGPIAPHPSATVYAKPVGSFPIDVLRGLVAGYSVRIVTGLNNDVDAPTGYPATVWTGGGLYSFLTTARPLQVRSTSALDTAAGSGAQKITLVVLDADYLEQTLTVNLNGTTPVALGTWLRVNRAVAGRIVPTPGVNTGELIVETADLPTVRLAHIAPSAGLAQQCVYTVPADHLAYLTFVRSGMYREAGPGAAQARLALLTWTPGGVWIAAAVETHNAQGTMSDWFVPEVPTSYASKTDIEVRCTHVSNDGTQVFTTLQFVVCASGMVERPYGALSSDGNILTEQSVVITTEGGDVLEVESF